MDKFITLLFTNYNLLIIWYSVIAVSMLLEYLIKNIIIKFWVFLISSSIYNFLLAISIFAFFKKLIYIKEGWGIFTILSLVPFMWAHYITHKHCRLLMSVPANLYSSLNENFLRFNKRPDFFDNKIILNFMFFILPLIFYLFLELIYFLYK